MMRIVSYHIIIRSSHLQATRRKQNTASKAQWHLRWQNYKASEKLRCGICQFWQACEVCTQGSFAAELRPYYYGYELGKMGASNKKSQQEDMVPDAFFKRACHGQKAWMTGVCSYYISPHAFAGRWSDQPQNSKYDTSHSPITRGRQRIQRWNFNHIPPKSSSPALLHKFFHEHWGKRASGRVPTSRSRPQKGGPKKAQVFSQRIWNRWNAIIGIVHSKCLFDKFRYFILMDS